MAELPAAPPLTPQFCFSTVFLRDFLRASRAVDDTITQHLNALVTPARAGFDPASTSSRSAAHAANAPPPAAARAFRDAVLFPAWQSRDDVIAYCSRVAADAVAKDHDDKAHDAGRAAAAAAAAADMPPVTERDDPYINRRQYAPVESPSDLLASLMRQEHGVESIVRARSWDVLQSRCGAAAVGASSGQPGWEAALAQWRAARP